MRIEPVRPRFAAGDEKRFYEFVSSIKPKDNVVLISHVADTDGVVSARILNQVARAGTILFLDHPQLNERLAARLEREKATRIFISDMSGTPEFVRRLERFARVAIIDHHLFGEDLNSERTVFLNTTGLCASYACYYLASRIRDVEALDWLAATACVADWTYAENRAWMKKVYRKYGERFVGTIQGVRRGKFWGFASAIGGAVIYFRPRTKKVYDRLGDSFGELGDLSRYSAKIDDYVADCNRRFQREKRKSGDIYLWEFRPRFPVGSAVSTGLSTRIRGKTLIICSLEGRTVGLSARRQDGKVDLPELLRSLLQGFKGSSSGGHLKAAGGSFPSRYKKIFLKRLEGMARPRMA